MKMKFKPFGILLLAGLMILSACQKDDDDDTEPVDLSPILTFIGGAGYTDSDTDMAPSATFKVGINAAENTSSKSNIQTFVVERIFNNTPTTVFEDDNINEPNYTWEQELIANTQAGEERWTFTVTDRDGESKELAFIITTLPTVTAYLDMTVGSFDDAEFGSFVVTTTGEVLTKAEAGAVQADVDFAFYKGAVNGSTFGAPSNSDVQAVFDLPESGWTTFNNTLFEMSDLNAESFDNIGGSYQFPEFTGTKDDINDLEVGDVVYFKTVDNKRGYIKVKNIYEKGDKIDIDMKVEN
jgi:hypothetical protein